MLVAGRDLARGEHSILVAGRDLARGEHSILTAVGDTARGAHSMLAAVGDIAREDGAVEPTLRTRAIPMVDLTTLADDDSDERVRALCARAAETGVAAVCIFPRFVATASEALAGTGVLVATVVNFPAGTAAADAVIAETLQALADGADEIDLVVPYQAAIAGDLDAVESMVRTIDEICGDHHLKAILETGALGDTGLIAAVARRAIAGGADFLKTSTGKIDIGATPEAAAAILDAIGNADRVVGIKLSGGVRTAEQAAGYLAQIDEAMGSAWASPATVRFGASGLLDDLLR